MMKRLLMATILMSTVLMLEAHGGGRGTAEVTINGKSVSVEYGRPDLMGRDMLGRASEGMVWRMGADATTTLTTSTDLVFGDQTVPAGKYALFAKKAAEGQWNLIINSDPSASASGRDEGKDVAQVPLKSESLGESVETFTIQLSAADGNQGRFSMAWGTLGLSTRFAVK